MAAPLTCLLALPTSRQGCGLPMRTPTIRAMVDETLVPAGQAGLAPRDLVPPQRQAPAPRVGTTWQLAADAFRGWRDGTPGAMDDLVTTMTPVLWHVARAHGLSRTQAEDVVQVTWMTLVRRADSIAEPQAVAAWLTTTARREAWRVARSGNGSTAVTDDLLAGVSDSSGSAEEAVVARDEGQRLWACVRALPERCRRLLRIFAFEERPDYAGIAEELQMPVGSIGPTRGRCLAKLRQALSEGAPA